MLTELDVLESAPALLTALVPPELKKEFAAETLKTPPARLLKMPPFTRTWPSVQAADPELSIVRDSVLAAESPIVSADVTVVLPLPDIVPPVQLNVGVEKLPLPVSVAPAGRSNF